MAEEMLMPELLEKFQLEVMAEKMQREKKNYSSHLENGFADYLRGLYAEIDRGNFRGYGKESITKLLDDSWLYDYTHVAEFFKHAKCSKVYIGNGNGLVREAGLNEEIPLTELTIPNGEQIAVFEATGDSRYKFRMLEEDRTMEIDMLLSPKEIVIPTIVIGNVDERRSARNEESLVLHVQMKQKTPEGVYYSSFDGQDYFGRGNVIFYENKKITGIEPEILDRLESKWLLGDDSSLEDVIANNYVGYPSRGSFRLHTVAWNAYRVVEPAQLASKMYRVGLPHILGMSDYLDISKKNYFEILDDEHELYALNDGEKRSIRDVQKLEPVVRKFEFVEEVEKENEEVINDINVSVSEETVVGGDSSVNLEDGNVVDVNGNDSVKLEVPEVIAKLMQIREYGIELSPEQEKIIRTYEKIHSDEFREFQANREERERRQREIREEVSRRNAEKVEWWNSPENPSNIREEKFERMQKQVDALEGVREIDPSLLTDQQGEMLRTGKEFFELKEMFSAEEHDRDTGMSNEAREWYQEHYKSK